MSLAEAEELIARGQIALLAIDAPMEGIERRYEYIDEEGVSVVWKVVGIDVSLVPAGGSNRPIFSSSGNSVGVTRAELQQIEGWVRAYNERSPEPFDIIVERGESGP